MDGVERTLPSELARPLKIEHLLNMKYSLQHQYIKSQFNRLIHNNRFIGPSEKKSWRHLIHSNATTKDVSPTRLSENEDRVSEEDELEAYKIGLRQSIGPLSKEQKEALKMTRGNLIYCSLIQRSQSSTRTGKKVILNQTTQVKEGTTITNQPWNQGKHTLKSESEPTIRVNFVALDFSFKELFQ